MNGFKFENYAFEVPVECMNLEKKKIEDIVDTVFRITFAKIDEYSRDDENVRTATMAIMDRDGNACYITTGSKAIVTTLSNIINKIGFVPDDVDVMIKSYPSKFGKPGYKFVDVE